GDVQQLFVGDRAPHEERQTRGELDIAHSGDGASRGSGFGAEDELRIREDESQPALDARLEVARLAPGVVHRHHWIDVVLRRRVAICAASDRGENLPRASVFARLNLARASTRSSRSLGGGGGGFL